MNEQAARIIILDTAAELLRALDQLLDRRGFSVATTTSLVELFDLLDKEPYDLLILEHRPERNWDIRLVTDHLEKGQLKHCIVTSNFVLKEEEKDESYDNIVWLKRPFKSASLVSTIVDLLNQKGQ